MEELLELVPRMTVKKMEQDKELIKKHLMSQDQDIADIDIRPQHDYLKYWDEGDKMRTVTEVVLDAQEASLNRIILADVLGIASLVKREGRFG